MIACLLGAILIRDRGMPRESGQVLVSRDENCREERSQRAHEFKVAKLRLKPKPRQF